MGQHIEIDATTREIAGYLYRVGLPIDSIGLLLQYVVEGGKLIKEGVITQEELIERGAAYIDELCEKGETA